MRKVSIPSIAGQRIRPSYVHAKKKGTIFQVSIPSIAGQRIRPGTGCRGGPSVRRVSIPSIAGQRIRRVVFPGSHERDRGRFNPLDSGATHSTQHAVLASTAAHQREFQSLDSGATHSTCHVLAFGRILAISFNPLDSGATHSTLIDLSSQTRTAMRFNPLDSGATHSTFRGAARGDQLPVQLVSIPSIAGQRIRL